MLDLSVLAKMSDDELEAVARAQPELWETWLQQLAAGVQEDLKVTQLAYYTVANPEALKVHQSMAREIAVVGGNRSSKTTTTLAELAIRTTNHIPRSLWGLYPKEKLHGPIRARVVCNSLTDTLEPVIKPKLQFDQWSGTGLPGQGQGHYGLIPRHCLQGGSWEKAYSERYRTLHVAVDSFWRGPDGAINSISGTSSIQFLSYDQALSAFTGASMHLVIQDELPPADVYRENKIRTLDVKGQIITGFTPPDEGGVNRADVSWFYDQVYERGLLGPDKDPRIDTFRLLTEQNAALDPKEIAALSAGLTEDQRRARLGGEFVHLSGVIYPEFADREVTWCLKCLKKVYAVGGTCPTCTGSNLTTFSHVVDDYEIPKNWPIVFVGDPHPRKDDVLGWFAIKPTDDIVMFEEMEQGGTYQEIKRAVFDREDGMALRPIKRIGDPNILTQTDDKQQRGHTMRQGYDQEGLRYDLANDEMTSGIRRVRECLHPDPRTRVPRFTVMRKCRKTIQAFTRWTWDEWSRQGDKEVKERPRDRFKDQMDLVRYLMNDNPTFAGYTRGLASRSRPVVMYGRR